MAESAGTLAESFVRIRTDDKTAISGLNKFRGTFQNRMAGLRKMATIAITVVGGVAGFQKLLQYGREAVSLWGVQEDAQTRLAGVIKATGGAAGFTAEQLMEQASAIQAVTTHGDEELLGGMAKLATFRHVIGDEFKRTMKLATDLADVGFGSVESSAMQMGKALEDPSIGLTMLRRIGVSFSQEQIKQIKLLQQEGKLREAQGVMLAEVEKQVGGVAEAMAKTDTGKMKQMANTIGDLKEQVGKALMPVMLRFREMQLSMWTKVQAAVDRFIPVIEWIADAWGKLSDRFKSLAKIGVIALGVSAAFAAIGTVIGMIAPALVPVLAIVGSIGAAVWAVKKAWQEAMSSDRAEAIKQDLREIWTNLKLIWENIKTTFSNVVVSIRSAFGDAGGDMTDKIGGAVEWITGKLNTLTTWLGVFSSDWGRTWEVAKLSAAIAITSLYERFQWMWSNLGKIAEAAIAGLVGVFDYLRDNWKSTLAAIVDVAMIQWGAIGAGLAAAFKAIEWDKLGEAFGNLVKTWLAHQWGLIGGLSNTFKWIIDNWQDVLERMLKAWASMAGALPKALKTAVETFLTTGSMGDAIAAAIETGTKGISEGIGESFSLATDAIGEFKDGYADSFKSAKDTLGVTQSIGESLSEIGSQAGTAAKAAASAAMEEVNQRLDRLKGELGNVGGAFQEKFNAAMADQNLTFEESEALKAMRGDLAAKIDEMKAEFDKRKKLMEEQKKNQDKASKDAKDAAKGLGDATEEAAKEGEQTGGDKSQSSAAVGITELQRKMQDIFGGTKDPVVNAVEKSNKILGQIRDQKNGLSEARKRAERISKMRAAALNRTVPQPSMPPDIAERLAVRRKEFEERAAANARYVGVLKQLEGAAAFQSDMKIEDIKLKSQSGPSTKEQLTLDKILAELRKQTDPIKKNKPQGTVS